jgi:hypothetical protein
MQFYDKEMESKAERHGPASGTTLNEKPVGGPQLSRIHELAFITTICTAQILALSALGQGLGQGLGEF